MSHNSDTVGTNDTSWKKSRLRPNNSSQCLITPQVTLIEKKIANIISTLPETKHKQTDLYSNCSNTRRLIFNYSTVEYKKRNQMAMDLRSKKGNNMLNPLATGASIIFLGVA